MDYEEAYREALERAKMEQEAFFNLGNISAKSAIERIFPELRESEDEKTRKAMLELVKQSSHILNPMNQKSMIAWLEKRGEQKRGYDQKYIAGVFEQVGLAKIARELSNDNLTNALQCAMIELSKKQGDQKPTDKVDPKFKVGDWIITNKGHVWLVDEDCSSTGYLYRLVAVNGKVEVSEYEVVDEHARLWTIEDAKDGDVLVNKHGCPLIFKDRETCWCYYGLTFHPNSNRWFFTSEDHLHPATKEQRDLLLSKMKEAGYEWNAEKKELMEIDLNPTEDDDFPEFESYLCLMLQRFRTKGMCTNGEIIDYVEEHSQKLRDILARSAWSEEDEKMFNSIIEVLEVTPSARFIPIKREIMIPWLKSLKDRVQPQPKQEWSEEDESMLNTIICHFKDGHVSTSQTREMINWLKNRLKFINSQSHWKPSKEQLEALWNAIPHIPNSEKDIDTITELSVLYEELKKL